MGQTTADGRSPLRGAGQSAEPEPLSSRVSAQGATVPNAVRPPDFTDEYRARVCKIGQGEACCRYLTMGGDGWGCAKKTPMRFAIDSRVDTMGAKGDNCGGCFEPLPAFVLLKERFGHPAGTLIYVQSGYDYGLASDDARFTGVPHTSMTLDPSGDYPGFTVPDSDFAPVEQVSA